VINNSDGGEWHVTTHGEKSVLNDLSMVLMPGDTIEYVCQNDLQNYKPLRLQKV